ncbi:MAG: NAD(P)-dependent oxidoreductase [Candidatus Aenigmatarchaeota archaeon]|nr:MAG: NAD(P)-dependent oxidoreductase [Candidatus Aenigmarchaeota archaeon]
MKVIVTGGSGFIGTNLMSFFIERGVEVCNLDIAPPRNKEHNQYWEQVDIRELEVLQEKINKFSPTHIFHLAARTGLENKNINIYAANIQGVENLILACKGLPNLQRIIFTSSMLVCKPGYLPKGDEDYKPNNLYGESKVQGEKIVRQKTKGASYSWVIVRPIGIWGPWFDTPYKEFFLAILKGFYVHIGKQGATLNLGFVGNTVNQLYRLATAPSKKVNGKVFYLGDTPPLNLRNWANLISQTVRTRKIWTLPVWVLKIAGRVGDLTKKLGWKNPLLTSFRLRNMLTDFIYTIDPIVAEKPKYTLKEGVQITVDWLREPGMEKLKIIH